PAHHGGRLRGQEDRLLGALPVERLGLHGEQEGAGGPDAGRLGRRRDAEQDDGEHHHGEDAERHHRRGQQLEDLEGVGIQARIVAHERQDPEERADPEPEIEALRGPCSAGVAGPPPRPGEPSCSIPCTATSAAACWWMTTYHHTRYSVPATMKN